MTAPGDLDRDLSPAPAPRDATRPAPVAGALRILRKRPGDEVALPDRVLNVDALTGNVTMTDCELAPTATGCTP